MFVEAENRRHGEHQPTAGDELHAASKQLEILAKQKLDEGKEGRKSQVAAAKSKASEIKVRLLHQLENGNHSDKVKAHLKNAIESCDNCLNLPDNHEEAHLHLEHLGHAHGHVESAIKEFNKHKHIYNLEHQPQSDHLGFHHEPHH